MISNRISLCLLFALIFQWSTSTIIIFRPQQQPQYPIQIPPPQPPQPTASAPMPDTCSKNSTNCTTTASTTTTPKPFQIIQYPPPPSRPQNIKLEFIPLAQLLFG